ncbi:MAG: septal ring lytic transglycosylase RlpA family protein [Gammaproteobacteria bacterium]
MTASIHKRRAFFRRLFVAVGMSLDYRECHSRFWRVALIGMLALVGCISDRPIEQSIRTSQEKSTPAPAPNHKEVGEASWYGPGFQGKKTANGETFNQNNMTAAHPSLPLGTKAKITNLKNGKKVEVRINDRGPYAGDRVIDVSRAAAKKLGMKNDGTTEVKIETKPAQ